MFGGKELLSYTNCPTSWLCIMYFQSIEEFWRTIKPIWPSFGIWLRVKRNIPLYPDLSLHIFWEHATIRITLQTVQNPKLKDQSKCSIWKGSHHWVFMKWDFRATPTFKKALLSLTHHWEKSFQLSENLSQSKCLEWCRQSTPSQSSSVLALPTPWSFHIIPFSYYSANLAPLIRCFGIPQSEQVSWKQLTQETF